MQIIKNRQLAQSHWQYPDFNAANDSERTATAQPIAGILFDYSAWLGLNDADKVSVTGLVLQPDVEIDPRSENLQNIEVIGVYFPNFSEGRGYTQAAILRNQLRYQGELRAINVYRDNLALLEKVGFDTFDLHPSENISDALLAFDELDLAHI